MTLRSSVGRSRIERVRIGGGEGEGFEVLRENGNQSRAHTGCLDVLTSHPSRLMNLVRSCERLKGEFEED